MRRFRHTVDILCAVGGAAIGTASLCQQANPWGVMGWLVSIVFAVRALATRRPPGGERRWPSAAPSLILRLILASLSVLSLMFLVTMTMAFVANPAVIGMPEKISIPILALTAILSTTAAVRITMR